ncbi:MAG: 5-oxoprolinase subunit B family protein [Nevskiaceae bacterium]
MKLRRAGPEGLLVELATLDEVLALDAELRRRGPAGVTEIVPAARTILLVGPDVESVAAGLNEWRAAPVAAGAQTPVQIPVMYDGPDLDEVCARSGLTRDALIAAHTGATLTAAFCGFAPGFAYLTGLPENLRVPRRATPRTRVDAGAVGLAGEFTAVYPRASPGGWQIIGHTALPMWDEARDPPNLIAPGARVRFVRA